jgi:hypothetical protein
LNLIGVLDLKDGNTHLDTAKQSAKREADDRYEQTSDSRAQTDFMSGTVRYPPHMCCEEMTL